MTDTRTSPPFLDHQQKLAVELHVDDVLEAHTWFVEHGFDSISCKRAFAVVAWNGALLMLGHRPRHVERPQGCVGELRLLHDDVDTLWQKMSEKQPKVIKELFDAPYGLREFVIESPFGISLRYATLQA